MKKRYNIQEIIIGCLKKQPKYQRALVDQYAGLLSVICKRYMKDNNFAKDMVQDSFVKIFKHLDKYDGDKGGFEAWISTLTIRLCLSKLSRKRLSVVSMQDYQDHPIEDVRAKFLLAQFETSYLIEMVKELPDGYREIFNMAVIDGFNHVDIAEAMNITVENSRARLSRAKSMMRKKINNLNKSESWVNSM